MANFILKGEDIKSGRTLYYTGKQGPEAFSPNHRLAKVYKRDDGDAIIARDALNKGTANHRLVFEIETK